jgi:hypothetical protein
LLPDLRQRFNSRFTPDGYRAFVADLQRRCGADIQFRVSETPCFFARDLMERLAETGAELITQLMNNAEYRRASDATIPPEFFTPREGDHPLFVQVDFGLVRDADGRIEPKLVELQAFASLYGFQRLFAQQYRESWNLAPDLDVFLGDLSDGAYDALMRRALVGNHDPEQVVLMEIDPDHQKTRPDFVETERRWGVRAVDIRALVPRGRELLYPRDGKLVPVRRIYNRTIVDELQRRGIQAPFDWRADLDVEWAGHPNWYFRISKFSLPWLKHPSVPRTWFLDRLPEVPADRENFVLKPPYSFAGAGVTFDPTDDDLAAIPPDRRHDYVLQERVRFTPVIDTPHGPTQVEIRMMYVWLDRLTPVLPLLRMGRGKMMGVDHNKNLEWVGASAALIDGSR